MSKVLQDYCLEYIRFRMAENKRYNIKPSKIIEDGFCIQDDRREHSFPTIDDKSNLIMYEKALNEKEEEIKSLKLENQLLLEEMKEIRDKLSIYLKIKGVDIDD